MIYTFKKLGLAAVLALLLVSFGSCEKESNNYDLTVSVTVYDSVKVQNALVHVFAPVKGSFIDYFQYTNEQGETVFKIDKKAVVEIGVSKGSFRSCAFKELFEGGNNIAVDLKAFGDEENGCQ